MIRFTIITCTFNAESVLQRTLNSVQHQSYKGIDHLIIDGKSRDNTVEMSKSYKSIVERESGGEGTVTIVSEKDGGIYDAMNKGLRMAKGDYVLFLNAGDIFHSDDTLKDIVSLINENEVVGNSQLPGVIYGDTDVVDATNRFVSKRIHQPPEDLTWRSFLDGMLICHQAFYARTDIAQLCTYDMRYSISADVDWCIKVMKECEKAHLQLLNTNMVLCNFLAGGISIKKHKQSLTERFLIMTRHYGLWPTIVQHIRFTYRQLRK